MEYYNLRTEKKTQKTENKYLKKGKTGPIMTIVDAMTYNLGTPQSSNYLKKAISLMIPDSNFT